MMHVCPAQVAKLATAAGAMKAVQLAVSGAFHTPLMQPAREALVEVLPLGTPQPSAHKPAKISMIRRVLMPCCHRVGE